MPLRLLHATSVAALLAAAAAAQDAFPQSLPVRCEATVDAAALATTGAATLRLSFTAEQELDAAWSVRVELRRGGTLLLRRDHAPPTASRRWPVGKPVAYALPLPFRTPPAELRAGDAVEVWLGFVDATGERKLPPLSARNEGGLAPVARFVWPEVAAAADAAVADAAIAAAAPLAAKSPAEAWDTLEFAFRRVADYAQKQKLQKALAGVGRMPPAPLTFEEADIVRRRVRDERARWLRQVAGRMHDAGKLHGALLLLDEVGGALQEDADRAVLGALGDAARTTKDRDAIASRIFALGKEQQAEAQRLDGEAPKGLARIAACEAMAKDPQQRAVARELLRTLEFTPEHREAGKAAREALEKAWLADVPPEQRAEADAARNHPCWARTGSRVSHRFVLIGPQALVDGVPADSLLRFDLAYLYLTDLFGRVPNPDGDRITVYWKELWEFGGGVGGGKVIDIGNADPAAKATRVDTGLLYHELTHCIDDTAPVYGGMREGLADFGAAFALLELGQQGPGRAAVGLAARAFLQDYLERDLEYWRIPNYGPSAGFFLHFMTAYGKSADGWQWDRYRRFFRDYRACKVKDARTPTLARAFGHHLAEAFGEPAWADLIRFRWPLLPEDREAARREQRAAAARQLGPTLEDQPGSPVPRDRLARELAQTGAGVERHGERLGVLRDWQVIGPFRKQGVDPDAFRFAPELEVDLQARYESINNNPTWRRPGPKPVTVTPSGWLQFDWQYMDDSAIYALTHVTVAAPTAAGLHLRGDDDVTLFVNDELIGKHDGGGGAQLGPWRPDWTVGLPDAIRFPISLRAGRNKVLVKVRNTWGGSGLTVALAQRNGLPLAGWTADAEPPTKKLAAIDAPDGRKWPSRFRARFDQAGEHKKLDAVVGSWRVRNGALEGHATDRGVEWRKHTVRPGFPKDSPSNLAWLPEKATAEADAFLLTVDLPADAPAPKLGLILQGDGQRDALCGWTLILEPQGEQVRAWLERYDQRVYQSDLAPMPRDGKKPVVLAVSLWANRLTVRLGEQALFDQAPLLPIPGKRRIGFATWGEALRVEEIELRAPARTR
ncbi:MAG: hypothetical protein ACK533_10185 [Planctomycetota bacterium]